MKCQQCGENEAIETCKHEIGHTSPKLMCSVEELINFRTEVFYCEKRLCAGCLEDGGVKYADGSFFPLCYKHSKIYRR